MRTLLTVLLTVLTLGLSACMIPDYANRQVVGSGKTLTKDFQLSDFNAIEVGNAFQAEITQADTFGVSVTTDDNLFDYLRVEKQGSTLSIYFERNVSIRQMSNVSKVKITLPMLARLQLSGASNGTISGFKSSSDFNANISGASKLRGDIEAGNARIEASGASNVTLSGLAKDTKLTASGASQMNLADWNIETADVDLSGASNASTSVKSKLDYNLSGASHLTYTGNPAIGRSATSGASSATKK